MNYLGDFASGKTVYVAFNTQQSDGTPITLAGTPACVVYKDGNTTETSTGVTLTVDFDGKTGSHLVSVDTSNAFYASGSEFRVQISAGTVSGVSVVGRVLALFSILNRSAATQFQVTGGPYALNSASFAFNAALPFTTAQLTQTVKADLVSIVGDPTGASDLYSLSLDYRDGTLNCGLGGDVNGNVAGDVGGKVRGGGVSTITGIGAQVDKTGYALTVAYDAAKTAATQTSVNAIPINPLLATSYTAPDNTGIARLTSTLQLVSGSTYRFTTSALVNAPTGGGGGGGLDGPNSVTLNFVDANGDPVPLVDFTVAGQGVGRADTDGVCAFGLESGVYLISSRPTSGTLFEDYSLAVTGTTVATIEGTAIVIPIPANPDFTTANTITYDGFGRIMAHAPIEFQIILPDDSNSYSTKIESVKSGADGQILQPIKKSTKYRARRGPTGAWVEFTTGTSGSYQLPAILGTP